MPQTKSRSLVTIRLQSPIGRLFFLAPALLALACSWFVVRWYVGDTVAEYTSGDEEGAIDRARLAVRWAPSDPFTHWRLGSLHEGIFSADNLASTLKEYEQAVALSPNDYRYWMELGDALEAAGDSAGAEIALRRAVALAPGYAQPRWFFGNVLLREGKTEEAFAQLVPAALADPQMRPQVLNLAWQVFNGDVQSIAKVACPIPELRVQFAIYLVNQGRVDDATRLWNSFSADDKAAQRGNGAELLQALMNAKQFRAAVQVMRDIEAEPSDQPATDQLWNQGFEKGVALSSTKPFHWSITSHSQVQIGVDNESAHTGHNSLRILFNVSNKLDDIPVLQTVAVQPDSQYRLEYYARTRVLNSGSTPQLTIRDAADNSTLAQSQPLPTGTHDWEKITIDFKTKPKRDGIIVGLYRAPCEEKQICPIFGYVWYDDFNLQRSSSARASR